MVVEVPEWRIVDDVTWHAVRSRFSERERGPRATEPATKYALTGIARCASCGGAVGMGSSTVVSVGGVRTRVPAYSCLTHRAKGPCAVTVAQPVAEVEGAVAAYVQRHVLAPEIVERVAAGVRDEVLRQAGGSRPDVEGMEHRLQQLRREQRNLAAAVAQGGDSIPELLDEMRGRQRRMEELQLAVQRARRTPEDVEQLAARVEVAVRAKLSGLREALTGDPAGAREAYLALFPDGLEFSVAVVGRARGPLGARRVWSVRGEATLGEIPDSIVTPPGLEPGISA